MSAFSYQKSKITLKLLKVKIRMRSCLIDFEVFTVKWRREKEINLKDNAKINVEMMMKMKNEAIKISSV